MSPANFFVRCFLCGSAIVGVGHGTYFAFFLSDSYLAIAIESRRRVDTADGRTLIFDNQCKIVPLSSRAVFIAEGIISNDDPRAPIFDGFPLARASYLEVPSDDLEGAAHLWATKMVPNIIAIYPLYK